MNTTGNISVSGSAGTDGAAALASPRAATPSAADMCNLAFVIQHNSAVTACPAWLFGIVAALVAICVATAVVIVKVPRLRRCVFPYRDRAYFPLERAGSPAASQPASPRIASDDLKRGYSARAAGQRSASRAGLHAGHRRWAPPTAAPADTPQSHDDDDDA